MDFYYDYDCARMTGNYHDFDCGCGYHCDFDCGCRCDFDFSTSSRTGNESLKPSRTGSVNGIHEPGNEIANPTVSEISIQSVIANVSEIATETESVDPGTRIQTWIGTANGNATVNGNESANAMVNETAGRTANENVTVNDFGCRCGSRSCDSWNGCGCR